MKNKLLFAVAVLGLLAGFVAAFILGEKHQPAAPLFAPARNPYPAGIYANGIIESRQGSGQNLNLYSEVPASVIKVLVAEGAAVHVGQALIELDDSVQRATTEQFKAQAEAADSLLAQMRAQPRKEQLDVARAQLEQARANLTAAEEPWRKLARAHDADPGAVSQDVLDNAVNQVRAARAARDVAQRQYDLTRAGAWTYDIRSQERQALAANQAWHAAQALLTKYTLRAPVDGVVMAINAGVGAFVSSQGVYSTYTTGQAPVLVMSETQDELAVRCYVDEILLHRLPTQGGLQAQMAVRGTDIRLPLVFDRIQPYVTPKIELTDQRQERVDLRVLPVVFHFKVPPGQHLYPGQMVDVYIAQNQADAGHAAASASAR